MSDTIFILGAGASVPYGFPSGEKLVRLIIDQLSNLIHEGNRKSNFLAKLMIEEKGIDPTLCTDFQGALLKSGTYSIDAFLERRKEFRELGKVIIATILLESEQTCLQNNSLFSPAKPEEHWYRYFFNEIKDQPHFKFRIYTFNYERSLEYFLIESYRNFFSYTDEVILERLKAMNITHLHGSLGTIESIQQFKSFNFGKLSHIRNYSNLETISERIEILYEVVGSKFEGLRQDIQNASNIVFLGFGFDKTNMNNIGLKDMKFYKDSGHEFYASTFGLSKNEVKHRLISNLHFILPSTEIHYRKVSSYDTLTDPIITESETAANFLKNTLPHYTYTN